MISEDKINYYLESKDKIQVLDVFTHLKAGDFLRLKYGQDNTSYKPEGWRDTAWHTIKDELPGLIGFTYVEYMEHCGYGYNPGNKTTTKCTEDMSSHEIIRILK
jgi:hypothetical protein